jgi:hypothetical protein
LRCATIRSVINCVYGAAIDVCSKERINGTLMTLIFTDNTALASSAAARMSSAAP